jgi:hypothetical protein
VEADVSHFATTHRDPDNSHFYNRALFILDWGWNRQQRLKRKAAEGKPGGGDAGLGLGTDLERESFIREKSAIDAILAPLLTEADGTAHSRKVSVSSDGSSADRSVEDGGSYATADETEGGAAEELRGVPFTELIEHERGRRYFLRVLNERRGHMEVGSGFEELSRCLRLFLDKCQEKYDVQSAQQTMLMANTFFRANTNSAGVVTSPGGPGAEALDSSQKEYLLTQIKAHPIWGSRKLWEDALMQNVAGQFDLWPQEAPWDDLPSDVLRESVIHVHNTVRG